MRAALFLWGRNDRDSIAAIRPQPQVLADFERRRVTRERRVVRPRQDVTMKITRSNGDSADLTLILRIDTPIEIEYYKNGGILQYVLRQLVS